MVNKLLKMANNEETTKAFSVRIDKTVNDTIENMCVTQKRSKNFIVNDLLKTKLNELNLL